MPTTLREIYAAGLQDGRAAAQSGAYCEDTAKRHARAYMRYAREAFGLPPRYGVRVLYAYHVGYTDGAWTAREMPHLGG